MALIERLVVSLIPHSLLGSNLNSELELPCLQFSFYFCSFWRGDEYLLPVASRRLIFYTFVIVVSTLFIFML